MKKLIILYFFLYSVSSMGQSLRLYQAKVYLGNEVKKAILLNVTDSTLIIAPDFSKRAWRKNLLQETVVIPTDAIRKIELRKKGIIKKGGFIGGLSGFGGGGLAGVSIMAIVDAATFGNANDNVAWGFAFGGMVMGSLTGTAIGAVINQVKSKDFIINQRPEVFALLWVQILPYCLETNQ